MENLNYFKNLIKRYNVLYFIIRVHFYPEGKSSIINIRCIISTVVLLYLIVGFIFANNFYSYFFPITLFGLYGVCTRQFEKKDYQCYEKYYVMPLIDNRFSSCTMGKIIEDLEQKGLLTNQFLDSVIEESELFLSLECYRSRSIFWFSLSLVFIASLTNTLIKLSLSHPFILIKVLGFLFLSICIALIFSGMSTEEMRSYAYARKAKFFANIIKRHYINKVP